MTDMRFGLQSHVDYLYSQQPRQLAFTAETPEQFALWQSTLRGAIIERLGLTGRIPLLNAVPPVTHLQSIERAGYTEEKYALAAGEGVEVPLYILVPAGEPPFKPVLVLHGHAPSVQHVLGNYETPEIAAERLAIDDNFAQALAQAGYLAIVPELRGFGERHTDQISEFDNSCQHLAFSYLMHGRTLLGERIRDALSSINVAQSRDDVVPGVMGVTGHSGGGTVTLWLAAIDERVTTVVPSCYFCSFKLSILGMRHCACNYVPDILEIAEMGDLGALIAPRPFRVIAGEHDPLFPLAGTQAQFQTVQRAYDLLDASENCSLTVHPGEHAYNHALSHEWFGQWL